MPLHDLLIGWGAWAVFILPLLLLWWLVLAEVWLAAESVLLLVTAVPAAAAAVFGDAHVRDVTVTRLRWGLFMVNLKGGQ